MERFLAEHRAGPRPRTTSTNPHSQLDQNAPPELQEKLYELGRSLVGVKTGPSAVSVPGARAFHLPACDHPPQGAFMVEREFAHIHPRYDGSLHMTLPPSIVDKVVANGWAEASSIGWKIWFACEHSHGLRASKRKRVRGRGESAARLPRSRAAILFRAGAVMSSPDDILAPFSSCVDPRGGR